MTDVIFIADVFENFRKLTQNFYQLHAAHILTSPGLAWQAALKMTVVKLDLFTDIDMHLFIEKGLRGGVSMNSHRHSEGNHPQCPTYDSTKDNKYITYFDANNLYGWAMSQPLPVRDFEWVSPDKISQQQIFQHPDDFAVGYILEVDMEYPPELLDLHNSYPLAPERMIIEPPMLSPTAMEILAGMKMKPASKSFNYTLFKLNKWTLPSVQKQQTMAKCIVCEAEHRTLSEDKKRDHIASSSIKLEWLDDQ
ncbi:hypothetical protein AVEN_180931-1 [Araneus ventricosus]|uniref:Uncharacterized protein n=1 Tax=Araneus ventricosus TaxID=182803 RepID=A0A4Y2FIV0_ARAVE|nr:hypothetical protein AVEN_180931-1 [Araneus ventricosus]